MVQEAALRWLSLKVGASAVADRDQDAEVRGEVARAWEQTLLDQWPMKVPVSAKRFVPSSLARLGWRGMAVK